MPYTALQKMLDDGFPPGLRVHWRSEFLKSISDECIETAVSAFEHVPSPLSAMLIEQFGGAVSRVYVNYIGVGEGPDRVRAAFGAEKFEKLRAIKTKYDPTNVFRINQNIAPG